MTTRVALGQLDLRRKGSLVAGTSFLASWTIPFRPSLLWFLRIDRFPVTLCPGLELTPSALPRAVLAGFSVRSRAGIMLILPLPLYEAVI